MLSLSKIAAFGTLSLAALATAAPSMKIDSKDLVARGDDKKGDYHYYDYDKDDFKDVKVEVIIVEVKKKDFVCILIDDKDHKDDKKDHDYDGKKEHDDDDKKDHGKDYKDGDDFIVKIKDFEFLCIEVDFKGFEGWKGYDWGYVKHDDGKKDHGDDKKDHDDDKKDHNKDDDKKH